jgi:glycosyltransferase involved in cell wall biosynthesis
MRILILFSQPWRVGGAETHVESLIAGLYPDHELTLAINRGGSQEKILVLGRRYPKLSIVQIQARGLNPLRWFCDIQRLINLVRQENIDIISAQQRTAGIWANLIGKKTGIPFVVTMHDPWHRAAKTQKFAEVFKHMIVVSRNLAQRLTQDFGFTDNAITLIHNGVDFNKFSPQDSLISRQKLNISADTKLLLHVSRLSSVKGAVALVLLESVPELLASAPEYQVVIIGEGPLRAEIETKAQALNGRYGPVVRVENFTSDLLTWYAAADVLVAEGRVAIEALACLKPVVAIRNSQTFFGAVSAQNIKAAVDVNFDGRNLAVNPHQLAAQIKKVISLPVRERQQILEYLRTKMSIDVMTEEYLRVFRTRIGERQKGQNAKYLAH